MLERLRQHRPFQFGSAWHGTFVRVFIRLDPHNPYNRTLLSPRRVASRAGRIDQSLGEVRVVTSETIVPRETAQPAAFGLFLLKRLQGKDRRFNG